MFFPTATAAADIGIISIKDVYKRQVMENANEDMKQYGNFLAKSNKENGVIKAIYEYVLKEDYVLA